MTPTHVQEAYMADENETNSTEETNQPAEEVEGQEPEETSTPEGETPDNEQAENDSEDQDTKLSHEDALAALEKTRKSEAKYRTRLREAEQKLSEAKTADEVNAAIEEIKNANATDTRDLLVENVALKHRLPDDLVETLKAFNGKTREDFEVHAKVLAKYASVESNDPDPDVSGGLDPNEDSDDFDPKAEAKKMRRQRRRGR